MFALSLLTLALSVQPANSLVTPPRECPSCGVYAGPNLARILDPYLRQVDIWPEFYAASCQFEVSRYAFVTLGRSACTAEQSYRASRTSARR